MVKDLDSTTRWETTVLTIPLLLPLLSEAEFDAVDLSGLLQCLQEERAAVALSIFLKRPVNSDSIDDLQHYVTNGADITRFTLTKVNLTGLFYSLASTQQNDPSKKQSRVRSFPRLLGIFWAKSQVARIYSVKIGPNFRPKFKL